MICTLHNGIFPKHEDEELQELLDLMTQKTGSQWYAKTYSRTTIKRWFNPDIERDHTSLMQDIGYGKAQIFYCVRTIDEAKAYLLGALGAYDKFDAADKYA